MSGRTNARGEYAHDVRSEFTVYPEKETMKKNRPKIHLPRTSFLTIIDVTAGSILLFILVLASMYWQNMPDRIPTHFDFFGQPNGWGGKSSFLIFPVMSLILFAMLTFFSFAPEFGNFPWEITDENAERQYHLIRVLLGWLKAEAMVILLYFEWITIRVSLGKAAWTSGLFMPAMLGVITCTILAYLVMGWRAR